MPVDIWNAYNNRDVHIRVQLKGNHEKRALFNFLVARMDADWPWSPPGVSTRRRPSSHHEPCTQCGGMNWQQPSIDVGQLQRLLKQVNDIKSIPGYLKLRIKSVIPRKKCEEKGSAVAAGGSVN